MRRRDFLAVMAGTVGAMLAPRQALTGARTPQSPEPGRMHLPGGLEVGWRRGRLLRPELLIIDDYGPHGGARRMTNETRAALQRWVETRLPRRAAGIQGISTSAVDAYR